MRRLTSAVPALLLIAGVLCWFLLITIGLANLIVRPQVWEQYHAAARNAVALIAHGRLQREGQVIHVLAQRLEDLTAKLANLPARSRDFR